MSAVPSKITGSHRLSTMRFMLRGKEEKSAAATSDFNASILSPVNPGLSKRLECKRDEHTTAPLVLETSLLDNGGIVAGRRSFGGANKTLEAAAKAAYGGDDAGVSDRVPVATAIKRKANGGGLPKSGKSKRGR